MERSLDPITPPSNDVLATFATVATPAPVTPAPRAAPIKPGTRAGPRGPNVKPPTGIAMATVGVGAASGAGEGVDAGKRRARRKMQRTLNTCIENV